MILLPFNDKFIGNRTMALKPNAEPDAGHFHTN